MGEIDFGDGGAFPEIHRVQYPLDMGRPGKKSNALALTTDSQGNVQTTAVVRHGVRGDKTVYSKYSDLVPKESRDEDLARPSETQIEDAVAEARKKMMAKIAAKTAGNRPGQTPGTDQKGSTYFNYSASETAGNLHSVQNRVIKMVEAQKDPLDVPKFRAKRVPAGPPSPPAPVLHSPPRKLTKEDQQDWKVPPSISRWKNPKGYVIPLDKRLAAEGAREGGEAHNVDAVAALTRGLEASARVQRTQIEERRRIQQQIEMTKKKKQDMELREIAEQAREAQALAAEERRTMTAEELDEERKREDIRHERRKAWEYARRKDEHRMARTGGTVVDRDGDRDVGERVALGMSVGGARRDASDFYDQRLFNQDTTRNVDLNNPEDEAGAFSKPLLDGRQHKQFRAKRDALDEEHRRQGERGLGNDKGLEFETREDVFGMDDILDDVKQRGKGKRDRDVSDSPDRERTRRRH